MDIRHLFLDHPHSVGETYFGHQRQAFSFGMKLVAAGVACLLHGLVPATFRQTGSRTVAGLYERMVVNRVRTPESREARAARLGLA